MVVVDDNQDAQFLHIIKQQFRGVSSSQNPKASMIGKVGFRASNNEEMLQVADMVCGAAAAAQNGENTWLSCIQDRDLNYARFS